MMNRLGIVGTVVGRLSRLQAWRTSRRNLAVPLRVYVAKGPGSSALTRLIAAGLRAGGLRTCAKTSTASPRIIFPDGLEFPVYRPGAVTQREQRRVMQLATRERADVLVLEGISASPNVAVIAEIQALKATHIVCPTARRSDTLATGASEPLHNALPRGTTLFTTELPPRELTCANNDTDNRVSPSPGVDYVTIDDDQVAAVAWDEMERFAHVEYREHVAMPCEFAQNWASIALRHSVVCGVRLLIRVWPPFSKTVAVRAEMINP